MAMDKVNLTAAVRTNLNQLQSVSTMISKTQVKLSTGLKVNSAIDDPSAFFSAKGLNDRASDLDGLKSNMDQAVSTIQAAINGIDAITDLVEQAKGLATKAKATNSTSERSSLEVQFNQLLTQIDNLANDSSYAGVNLLKSSPDDLEVTFNADGTNTLTIDGTDVTTGSSGLNISAASSWASSGSNADGALDQVTTALDTLRTNAATLGSNNAVLQTRLDFTQALTNTLEEGAGKLTLADLNEESANLLALQTRQSIGVNALSMASQQEQSILRLFG